MKKITVIGTGYVGLVTGACLADIGHQVICVDIDKEKIKKLKKGIIPIYEPGLEEIVDKNFKSGNLQFTTDTKSAVEASEVVFIAVGTPSLPDGTVNLDYVKSAAKNIAQAMNGYKVIVDKSTVPVGTGDVVGRTISQYYSGDFDVVSNPEFLREGSAVYDFLHPDRVVLGVESERAGAIMKDVYRSLYLNETPFVETNLESAEMIKYASNAFLAVKITFINEIANLCEQVGADVKAVAHAMGKDGRIGPKFLHPGPGYGGSCFPKDTRALADIAKRSKSRLRIVEATIEANEAQKQRMVEKILAAVGSPQGKTFAILGLAFKPNTDDMREAPALTIIERLVSKGARIKAYDPEAMKEAAWRLVTIDHSITYCLSEYDTMKDSDALIILTEWNQFRNLDLAKAKQLLKTPLFFDFRNLYERKTLESLGFSYQGVGR